MADPKCVLIRHDDGREYSITERAFTDARIHPRGAGSYADQGFAIVSHEDGTPYEGPKTKREIERAAEARQAAALVRPATRPSPRLGAKGKGA